MALTIESMPGAFELTPPGVSSKLLAVELIHPTIELMVRALDVMVKTIVVQLPSVSRMGSSVGATGLSVAGKVPSVSANGALAVQWPSSNFSRIEALTYPVPSVNASASPWALNVSFLNLTIATLENRRKFNST